MIIVNFSVIFLQIGFARNFLINLYMQNLNFL